MTNPIHLEKVFKYINLEIKKIKEIEFVNYQRAYESNTLQWRSKIHYGMIYKMLLLNGKFLQSIGRGTLSSQKYLDIAEEINKMCAVYGGKTYESFDWVKTLHSIISWPVKHHCKNCRLVS